MPGNSASQTEGLAYTRLLQISRMMDCADDLGNLSMGGSTDLHPVTSRTPLFLTELSHKQFLDLSTR